MKLYGIKNCDTVKKALTWLKAHHLEVEFHDFKKLGISDDKLNEWANSLGWETLLNKRGTTWKQLDEAMKNAVVDAESAFALMKQKTSVIKRPVLESKGGVWIGFDEEAYNRLLG